MKRILKIFFQLVIISILIMSVTGCSSLLGKLRPVEDQTEQVPIPTVSVSPAQTGAYKYGDAIIFGVSGNYSAYSGKGWGKPEKGFTWTVAKEASLSIPLISPMYDLELSMSFIPFVEPGKHESQKVVVLVNNQRVGEWELYSKKTTVQSLNISKELVKDSKLILTFQLPDAAAPSELGVNADVRKLGIAVSQIVLKEKR